MSTVLYTKYSNDRADAFAIYTEICEEAGERVVYKRPAKEAAEAHLAHLARMAEKLAALYEGTPIRINRCEQQGDALAFEYLEGETYEARVDAALEERGQDAALQMIRDYMALALDPLQKEPFHSTDGFVQVFGSHPQLEGCEAAAFADIDLILSNLLCQSDGGYSLIDYEWSFDFPIPLRYIRYRILHYYVDVSRARAERLPKLYEAFGINEEMQALCEEMEVRFQQYINGTHRPIRSMYEAMSPGTSRIAELLVFADDATEPFYRQKMPGGEVQLGLTIPAGTKELRFDPGEESCLCRYEFTILSGDGRSEKPALYTNGGFLDAQIIYFPAEDPQIRICLTQMNSGQKLKFSLQTRAVSGEVLDAIRAPGSLPRQAIDNTEVPPMPEGALRLAGEELTHRQTEEAIWSLEEIRYQISKREMVFHIKGWFFYKTPRAYRLEAELGGEEISADQRTILRPDIQEAFGEYAVPADPGFLFLFRVPIAERDRHLRILANGFQGSELCLLDKTLRQLQKEGRKN